MSATERLGVGLDLALVIGLLAATTAVSLVPGVPRPLAWPLGIAFLLIVPGYALVSALFPKKPALRSRTGGASLGGPSWAARLGLSLVLSVLVVGLVGYLLSVTVGLTLEPAVLAIDLVTLAGIALAARRRSRLRPGQRADPLGDLSSDTPGPLFADTIVGSVAMAFALLLLVSAVAYTAAAPPEGPAHSEIALLTDSDDGGLVAADYPETYVAGESQPLSVSIENHEHGPVTYGAVVVAESVTDNGTVTDREQIDQFELSLDDDERQVVTRDLAPTTAGDRVRLRVLVYEGGVPADATPETADHALRIWTTVVEDGAA